LPRHFETIGLNSAVSDYASFYSQSMLSEAFTLCPFGQERPCCGTVMRLGIGMRLICTHCGELIISHEWNI